MYACVYVYLKQQLDGLSVALVSSLHQGSIASLFIHTFEIDWCMCVSVCECSILPRRRPLVEYRSSPRWWRTAVR